MFACYRVAQFLVEAHVNKLSDETIDSTVKFACVDITRFETLNHAIQWPALQILVGIGRRHCEKIMAAFLGQFNQQSAPHHMILNCIGNLATANSEGILKFIKTCLGALLPTLSAVRLDYHRQAHAFLVGKFCEAVIEHKSNTEAAAEETETTVDISAEVGVIYDVFVQNWLPGRDPKVCGDVLAALVHIFPLLQSERIADQSSKICNTILNLYRRSIDRVSITQFLSSVIETCLKQDKTLLDPISNSLIVSLFDLVIVNPDFEKPVTVKSHYEVLRCFDLLADVYGTEIVGVLLIQLRSNNERERIKSVLVVTHLCSTAEPIISKKVGEFVEILKQMIANEKSIKMKMVLLKIIVAFAEKKLIDDLEFVQFIIKNSCIAAKVPTEWGAPDEYTDFVKACNSSLSILCSTVGTLDDILKKELLQVSKLFIFGNFYCFWP